MPEPAIAEGRSRRLTELEGLHARKSDLELRLVTLRREQSELESEIKIAGSALDTLVALLFGYRADPAPRGRESGAPSTTVPAPSAPPPAPAAPPRPVAVTVPHDGPTTSPPAESPLTADAGVPPTMARQDPGPDRAAEAPLSALDRSRAVEQDAFSTPTQQRRAHVLAAAAAAIARLGGAAKLDDLVVEYRKEDPGDAPPAHAILRHPAQASRLGPGRRGVRTRRDRVRLNGGDGYDRPSGVVARALTRSA